jgi:branched-chain amino acid aminotransferase
MEIRVTKSTTIGQKPCPKDSELGFGKYTTDHMFLMDYHEGEGWHDARIEPYHDLHLDPTALVLHYNQEVFEGLKAYYLEDGGVGLFRPEKNIERMNSSARRMVMPEVDPDLFLRAVKELVLLDRAWIPTSKGTSLYIRPTMIANEPALGVKPSEQYLFYIVLCAVGAYYPEGFSPTRIFVSNEYIRSAKGGAGSFKTSCNYGPTLMVSKAIPRFCGSMQGNVDMLRRLAPAISSFILMMNLLLRHSRALSCQVLPGIPYCALPGIGGSRFRNGIFPSMRSSMGLKLGR